MSAATRTKRYRQRRATGVVVLQVPALEYPLVEALLTTRRLTVAEALDRRRVAHAAAEVLHDFARRWGEKP